mmetsp:Transcript_45634/g.75862  ORF Transcript_45634/g.75862 Transcript_45634/m.75862 type:complete len:659 (-) Transcript_45634:715-2691(-)
MCIFHFFIQWSPELAFIQHISRCIRMLLTIIGQKRHSPKSRLGFKTTHLLALSIILHLMLFDGGPWTRRRRTHLHLHIFRIVWRASSLHSHLRNQSLVSRIKQDPVERLGIFFIAFLLRLRVFVLVILRIVLLVIVIIVAAAFLLWSFLAFARRFQFLVMLIAFTELLIGATDPVLRGMVRQHIPFLQEPPNRLPIILQLVGRTGIILVRAASVRLALVLVGQLLVRVRQRALQQRHLRQHILIVGRDVVEAFVLLQRVLHIDHNILARILLLAHLSVQITNLALQCVHILPRRPILVEIVQVVLQLLILVHQVTQHIVARLQIFDLAHKFTNMCALGHAPLFHVVVLLHADQHIAVDIVKLFLVLLHANVRQPQIHVFIVPLRRRLRQQFVRHGPLLVALVGGTLQITQTRLLKIFKLDKAIAILVHGVKRVLLLFDALAKARLRCAALKLVPIESAIAILVHALEHFMQAINLLEHRRIARHLFNHLQLLLEVLLLLLILAFLLLEILTHLLKLRKLVLQIFRLAFVLLQRLLEIANLVQLLIHLFKLLLLIAQRILQLGNPLVALLHNLLLRLDLLLPVLQLHLVLLFHVRLPLLQHFQLELQRIVRINHIHILRRQLLDHILLVLLVQNALSFIRVMRRNLLRQRLQHFSQPRR